MLLIQLIHSFKKVDAIIEQMHLFNKTNGIIPQAYAFIFAKFIFQQLSRKQNHIKIISTARIRAQCG